MPPFNIEKGVLYLKNSNGDWKRLELYYVNVKTLTKTNDVTPEIELKAYVCNENTLNFTKNDTAKEIELDWEDILNGIEK